MAKNDPALAKIRKICLSLPGTKETMTWGKPHFRVGEKIFAGYGQEGGKHVIGFKLEMAHAKAIIKDPRFYRAPYVGHKGWVSMDAAGVKDWEEVRSLILESYSLIAPKKLLANSARAEAGVGKRATLARRKSTARQPVAKKATRT